MDIYSHYKWSQLSITLRSLPPFLPSSLPPSEREATIQGWWDQVHERNSAKMLELCLEMRGFYLKAGQFLGTRPDFMPLPFIEKLSTLHDRVPPLGEKAIRKVVEEELEMYFSEKRKRRRRRRMKGGRVNGEACDSSKDMKKDGGGSGAMKEGENNNNVGHVAGGGDRYTALQYTPGVESTSLALKNGGRTAEDRRRKGQEEGRGEGRSVIDEVFLTLDLKKCVGSASICQVHEGRLRGFEEEEEEEDEEEGKKGGWRRKRGRKGRRTRRYENERVACKIQYPNAESVMRSGR